MNASPISVPAEPRALESASRRQPAGREIRICLLGASLGTQNLGVNALAHGTIAALLNQYPGAMISLLDYGHEPVTYKVRGSEGFTPVQLVNLRFSKKFYLANNIARLLATALCLRAIPSPGWRRRLAARNPQLNHILSADLVCSIAGGDSFSDIYGLGRFLYVTLPQFLVLLLGMPLVLLPQTYGPFEGGVVKFLTRSILRHARLVLSRDQAGLQVVKDLAGGEARNARFAYDMGFALQPFPPEPDVLDSLKQAAAQGPLVGLNVSGLLYSGGYTGNNMFGLKSDYQEMIHALLRVLIIERKAQVLLIPHVLGADSESDITACEAVMASHQAEFKGHLHFFRREFDQHQVKFVIGQCDFFLGSRMHACIAALSQCVPAVGLAYSQKFAGVLDSIGGGATVVDLRRMEAGEVAGAAGAAFDNRKALRGQLEARMPGIKKSVLGLFADSEFEKIMADSSPAWR